MMDGQWQKLLVASRCEDVAFPEHFVFVYFNSILNLEVERSELTRIIQVALPP